MKGQLVGANELKARLRSMGQSFKPMGKDWANTTARTAAGSAPRGRTGKLRGSFKVRTATARRAIVDAIWYAKFTNKGTRPHTITAKGAGLIFNDGGNTIFTKKVRHPGTRGTGYVNKAAHKGLRDHVSRQALIDAWNRGA